MISTLFTSARRARGSARNSSRVSASTSERRYSASSRMWRRLSRGEGDMFRLVQDVRPDVRAERVPRDELDLAPQQFLEEVYQAHEVREGLLILLELNQQIHVAPAALLPTRKRAEEREPPHP